jgi:hypothetical protein
MLFTCANPQPIRDASRNLMENTEWILELSDETKKPMFRIRLVAGASLISDVGCWRKAAVHIQTGSRGR